MALIKCTECGHMISDKAVKCPKCGCSTKEETVHPQEDDATDYAPVYYEEESHSNKWLYVIIALLLVALACGGFWLFKLSSVDHEIRQLIEKFAKAVETGDRMTIRTLYPDTEYADSLVFIYDENNLHIEKNGNEWKVTVAGNVGLTILKNAENKLYINESYGIFSYPDSLLIIAKGTGWFDSNLNDKQNAERLSDTQFISWLENYTIQDIKSKVKISATSTKGPGYTPEDIPATSGDTKCTVTVTNLNNFDIADNDYHIQAREKWMFWTNWETPTYEGEETPEYGDYKTLSGKPIPANESISYTWKGNGYYEMAHSGYIKFKLDATIVFTPLFEKNSIKNYHFSGNEYEKYLAEKEEVKSGQTVAVPQSTQQSSKTPTVYYVVIGSYSSLQNAIEARNSLMYRTPDWFPPPPIFSAVAKGKDVYRLCSGIFKRKDKAKEQVSSYKNNLGINAWIWKNKGLATCVDRPIDYDGRPVDINPEE